MKNKYDLQNINTSTFLTAIRENVRPGHYIIAETEDSKIKGKVTYITSDFIYIDKSKILQVSISRIIRMSKQDFNLLIKKEKLISYQAK